MTDKTIVKKKQKRSLAGQIKWANKHVRDYAKTNGHPKEVCEPSDKCFKHHSYCTAKFEEGEMRWAKK